MPPVFGARPMDEAVWTVMDREWNGGMHVYTSGLNEPVHHIFETSSWMPVPGQQLPEYCLNNDCVTGLERNGPIWNPECQDRVCTCDERVKDHLGMESYQVYLQTAWWPEWTFQYDEYYCAHSDWSPCFYRNLAPIGHNYRGCDFNGNGQNDPDY
jgi:hypothetical protein